MNTTQIKDCLTSDAFTRTHFKGVYPRNAFIATSLHANSMYICNLDNSDKPGSHWIAVYITSKLHVEYFDSYGLPPIFTDLQDHLRNYTSHILINHVPLQGLNSVVCGQHCLVFLLLRARSYTMSEITRFFSGHTPEVRDHSVFAFIDHYFAPVLPGKLSIHQYSS